MSSAHLQPQPPDLELNGHESGGQLLCAALSLAAATGQGFVMRELRAGRDQPGLLRRHLTVVQAAAEICDAQTRGAELGSTELTFVPGKLRGGVFSWAVGAAGNASLVLQTVLPALASAPAPATVTVTGGTHTPTGPPLCFLAESWLPQLRAMGANIELTLERWGFFPAGGGRIRAHVTPSPLSPLRLLRCGPVVRLSATAAVAIVNPKVARLELRTLATVLKTTLNAGQTSSESPDFPPFEQQVQRVRDSSGPGLVLWLRAETANVHVLFSAVAAPPNTSAIESLNADGDGRPGDLATQLATQMTAWLDAGAPAEPHLGAALLVPMALAGGGRLAVTAFTEQLHRRLALIERFLPVQARREALGASGAVCISLSKGYPDGGGQW